MINVDQVISDYYPSLDHQKLHARCFKSFLKKLLHEQDFVDFGKQYPHLKGMEFIEQLFEYLSFDFTVSDSAKDNIPYEGKVVIVANHPIGTLDGLALLKMIYKIRPDVQILANDVLLTIQPLRPFLLPIRVLTGVNKRDNIQRIHGALQNEQALIIFPAGEVSRMSHKGIRDSKWHRGFLKIAERAKAPILPIHISGHNSTAFYLTSIIARPLSTLMLVRQMFYQKKKEVHLTIGALIPYSSYHNLSIQRKEKVKLFKKHIYRIGNGKKPLFVTESPVARPERKTELKRSISNGTSLSKTPDGKIISLFQNTLPSPLMREIGTLRERTFRAVGEGTGKRRDIDNFDTYYNHLILWDEYNLEIAGAYRFIDAEKTIKEKGPESLYTASLFTLDVDKCYFLDNGLELGRSFVQQKYWGSRSLDYLWFGIGAYLAKNPQYRYLFGPVSISSTIPEMAKDLLVYFYKLYFSSKKSLGLSRNPFSYSQPISFLEKQFTGDDYKNDFKKLKSLLNNYGTAVPPLYKQYAELCHPGGVEFLDFNIDPTFNNCIDSLVIVDITKIKDRKRKRYIDNSILNYS